MYLSDTLSRAVLQQNKQQENKSDFLVFQLRREMEQDAEIEEEIMEKNLFVTDQRLIIIKEATARDPEMQSIGKHHDVRVGPKTKKMLRCAYNSTGHTVMN